MQLFKKGIGYEAIEGEKRMFLSDLDVKFLKHNVARIDFTDVPELLITDPSRAGDVSRNYHKQQRANALNEQRIKTLLEGK